MEKFGQLAAGTAVELFLLALALGILYRVWGKVFAVPQRLTVLGFQRGVVLLGSQLERVVEPGRYWITPKRTLVVCDMRPKPFQVPAQALLTADKMGVRVSLAGEYRVLDPGRFVMASSDAFGSVFLELRQALLTAIAETQSEDVLQGRSGLIDRLRELVLPRASELGIELMQLNVWEAAPIGWIQEVG